jgi:hypothetical protein
MAAGIWDDAFQTADYVRAVLFALVAFAFVVLLFPFVALWVIVWAIGAVAGWLRPADARGLPDVSKPERTSSGVAAGAP